ncbi:MAG: nucleotidyltransferase domain-containing protein [Cyanobacterium sp. T60_A2020_053]|nr:nucleotidyltransferase domain-containing protein [Cyanobacterium sp. T60_A2020_053]
MTTTTVKNHSLEPIIKTLKNQFIQIYNHRLTHLILFGSQARGDAQQYSDIDILVVLKGNVNCVEEIKSNSNLISNLCLDYDAVINCFYISESRLNEDSLFINNIKKEGLLL